MKPVLKYSGGKSKEIPRFMQYIPKDYNRYIEPFLGGRAVFFHLAPDKAILNDVNTKLMGFYKQLQKEYPAMCVQLDKLQAIYEKNRADYVRIKALTPDVRVVDVNEMLYYRMRELFNNPTKELLEGVVYYFINKTAYLGMIRYNQKGKLNIPYGRYAKFTNNLTQEHSELLQNAQLHNTDYSEIFAMAQPDDFMFLDPPYDCVFTDYGNANKKEGFGEQQQRRLAQDFRKLPCKALMIIGKTALTEVLYGEYIADEYNKNYAVDVKNRVHEEKAHIVVKNY